MPTDAELWQAGQAIVASDQVAHARSLGITPVSGFMQPGFAEVWFGSEYPTARGRQQQPRTGWECPRCHACWGPHVHRCGNCGPQPETACLPPREGGLCSCDEPEGP